MEQRLYLEALAENLKVLKPDELIDMKNTSLKDVFQKDIEVCSAIISNDALEKYGICKGQNILIKKIQFKPEFEHSYLSFMESINNELVVVKLGENYIVRHCQSNPHRNFFVLNTGKPKVPSIAAFTKDKIMNLLLSIYGIIIGTI